MGTLEWVLAATVCSSLACGSSNDSPGGSGGNVSGAGDASGGTVTGSSGEKQGGASGVGGANTLGGKPSNAGSGGLGQAGDDPGTPTGRCNSSQPFGAPQPITELNTDEHEAGPRLSSDELRLLYLCNLGTSVRLCIANRKSRAAKFGEPQVALASGAGVGWLSDDGMLLLYEDDTNQELLATGRNDTGEVFSQGGPLLDGFGDPYVVGGENGNLYLSNNVDLFVTPLHAWSPGDPTPMLGVLTAGRQVRPVLTPDELTLYYGTAAMSAGPLDLQMQERKSKDEPFGAAVPVAELNTPEDEFPGFISADGCRLYFDGGSFPRDLFMAERMP